jgi:hypothetical protein
LRDHVGERSCRNAAFDAFGHEFDSSSVSSWL